MRHILFQAVWTEMCVSSVCTQPPYNDKDPPSVFFFYLVKSFPLSQIEPISDACLCDVTQTGPSHNSWLTVAFQHRLDWCLTLDPPWVSCHQFIIVSPPGYRQEWLLSDLSILLLDVIMNIAVVIYSRHLNRWRRSGLRLFLKGMRPRST